MKKTRPAPSRPASSKKEFQMKKKWKKPHEKPPSQQRMKKNFWPRPPAHPPPSKKLKRSKKPPVPFDERPPASFEKIEKIEKIDRKNHRCLLVSAVTPPMPFIECRRHRCLFIECRRHWCLLVSMKKPTMPFYWVPSPPMPIDESHWCLLMSMKKPPMPFGESTESFECTERIGFSYRLRSFIGIHRQLGLGATT